MQSDLTTGDFQKCARFILSSVGEKGRETHSADLGASSFVDPSSECSEIGRLVVLRARV